MSPPQNTLIRGAGCEEEQKQHLLCRHFVLDSVSNTFINTVKQLHSNVEGKYNNPDVG